MVRNKLTSETPAKGYTGRILRVDLSEGTTRVEPLDYVEARRFIGGRGLGAKMLFDEVPPGTDPLGPDNKLFFVTGPVTGTIVPGSSRYVIVTKSPETNLFLDTYGGGYFPAEIKYAGYDAIVIEGQAQHPTYLWVSDEGTELRDATHLWGKPAYEGESALKEEVGDESARVAIIGPAGEKLSNLAVVQNDYYHQCARGGAGAVMGSKRLKAVVVRGSQGVRISDPKGLINYILTTVEQKVVGGGMAGQINDRMKYGTPLTLNLTNAFSILPTRNFQQGKFEGAQEIDGYAFRKKVVAADTACLACNVACTKFSRVKGGPYQGARVGGPEYETNAMLGANLGIDSMEFIVRANALCDDLGLDTVGAGTVIGFAMECYERGLLGQDDVDGLDLRFGNYEAVLKLLPMIAHRQGLGDLLAQGVRRAAEAIGQGSEEFAMQVKGLEYPAYRPSILSPAFALNYAICERGACHRRAWPTIAEQSLPRFSTEGRARLIKALYDERIPWHCGVNCDLAVLLPGLNFDDAAFMFSAVTGWDLSSGEMQTLAERVSSLIRCLNLREGAGREDDTLSPRSFRQEVGGPAAGLALTKDMLDTMLDEYYGLRGWDRQGVPTQETLHALGLDDAAGQISASEEST